MTLTERDRRLLTFAPALLAVALFAWRVLLPGWDAHDALTRRLETAGRVPEAWESRLAVAEKGRQAAEGELEKERRRFADGMRELRREQPAANSTVRTKPGALVALNRSVAASGAKIVAAMTIEGDRARPSVGMWNVTFLATYDEMRLTLRTLSEEPGVLVRRIDRLAAEDAGAKPIWKLTVEM